MEPTNAHARRFLREAGRALLDLLLPRHCVACGQPAAAALCAACADHLVPIRPPWCARCGVPLLPGQRCSQDHGDLRGLAFARAAFAYAGTGGALVRRLKLSAEFAAVPRLAAGMAAAAGDAVGGRWRRAVLVPVPLHRTRRRQRGFDQALLLAGDLGRRLGLDVAAGAVLRVAATLPQGDPRVTSRQRNVETAFAPGRARVVAGRRVVLVDDVATSLATARACAAVLAACGAVQVGLVTACRS